MNTNLTFLPNTSWLAPLAGWSDLAFRLICREQGASVACTEMISAKGLVYGGRNTQELLCSCQEDAPLVVQIFGAESDFMAKGISLLQEQGFKYFDVNVGCSVAKVVKTGAGAAMLKDIPNLLSVANSVIRQTQQVQGGMIGFKIRLGFEMGQDVYLDTSKALEDLGANWITLHPRYAKQSFSGTPDYSALKKLKTHINIPVIASGDLFTAQDGVRVLLETGVDTVMYARGAMSNPFIFQEHQALWEYRHEEVLPKIHHIMNCSDISSRLADLIRRHMNYAKTYAPRTSLLKMRTILPRYVKNLEGAKAIRQALVTCKSYEELDHVLDSFFQESVIITE